MKRLARTFTCLTPLLLGGCATVTTGTTEKLSVDVQGPYAGQCTVELPGTKPQYVFSGQPFTVARSGAPMTLRCWADGYDTTTVQVSAQVQERARIGLPMGMLVDYLSGARYEYPAQITVPMRASEPVAALSPAGMALTGP